MNRAPEIKRLFGLVSDGLDGWCYGGASREEEDALYSLRDLALSLDGENRALRTALEGLMEIAELALPDSYFTTDSRVVAARVALTEKK